MFSGSLVALVTPMLDDGAIDIQAWERLLELHVRGGTAAVVVGGSTGESVALTDAEGDLLIAHARRCCAGRMARDRGGRRKQHGRGRAAGRGTWPAPASTPCWSRLHRTIVPRKRVYIVILRQ